MAKSKVMCFGTFDLLHKGHEYYLLEARKLGDELVVVVARDDTVLKIKGRKPVHSEKERAESLRKLGFVDKAVIGNEGDKLKVVVDEKPDIIALGYDQTFFTEQLSEKLAQRGVKAKIVRIASYEPEKYKTSLFRKQKPSS